MPNQDAKQLRNDLQGQITRAHLLAARSLEQLADGDLRHVDRESAGHRAKLAIQTAKSLEASAKRMDDATKNQAAR